METPYFPDEIPVMVLDGITLFPNTLLPLHIFEPRYREMLQFALESDRIFAVAMPRKKIEGDVFNVAGAGLIRACVKNADGTSNLILQGIQRVRFTGWKKGKSFRMACAEPLFATNKIAFETEALVTEAQRLCRRFKTAGVEFPEQFSHCLEKAADADVFSDVMSSLLIKNSATRQSLLEELDVTQRLKDLIAALRDA